VGFLILNDYDFLLNKLLELRIVSPLLNYTLGLDLIKNGIIQVDFEV
jgi:hypothetical protein